MIVYLGCASTLHDSALAVVNEDGELIFAGANERSLKHKRAWNSVPDSLGVIEKVLEDFVGDSAVSVGLSRSDRGLRFCPCILDFSFWQRRW